MPLSIRQVKAARALLDWSQERLSEESGVPLSTLKRIESNESDRLPESDNAKLIESALLKGGVVFQLEKGRGLGVRLKKND